MVLGDGVKEPKQCELKNIKIVRKSIFKTFIRKGEGFRKEFNYKRPGKGISPRYWNSLIGKISKNDYLPDEIIKWQ